MSDVDFLGFLGPTGTHPLHTTWNQEYTQNLVMKRLRAPTKGNPGQWALHGTPGLTAFADSGRGKPLDIWFHNGRMVAADADYAYEIASDGTMTDLGAVQGDNRVARFASNAELGHQVFFNVGGLGYVYDTLALTFTQVTDAEFPAGARFAQYVDGYFVVSVDGSLLFAVCDLFDGLSWSTFDNGRKSSTSDNLQGHYVVGRLLWLFGLWGTEIWYNSGDPSFPYTPVDNVIIPIGLHAPDSLYDIGGLCFLGQVKDGGVSIYEQQGYNLSPWSPPEVDDALTKVLENGGTLSDAIGFGYQKGQESFYVLYCPSADLTLVGNRTTKLWHRWSYFDALSGADTAALARSHAVGWNNEHYVSDRRTGKVYKLKGTDDNGSLIKRVRRTPHIAALQKLTVYNNLRLLIQTGEAPLIGNDEDIAPHVAMRCSDNAGKTWGDYDQQPLGEIGEFDLIIDFPALGSSRKGKTFEVVIVARHFIGISGAVLDLEQG